jgi:hypothetical protein
MFAGDVWTFWIDRDRCLARSGIGHYVRHPDEQTGGGFAGETACSGVGDGRAQGVKAGGAVPESRAAFWSGKKRGRKKAQISCPPDLGVQETCGPVISQYERRRTLPRRHHSLPVHSDVSKH